MPHGKCTHYAQFYAHLKCGSLQVGLGGGDPIERESKEKRKTRKTRQWKRKGGGREGGRDKRAIYIRIYLSTSEGFRVVAMACGCWSVSLKTLSMTDSSVLVVSSPQNAHQSLTTKPAASTSLPLFTVPA